MPEINQDSVVQLSEKLDKLLDRLEEAVENIEAEKDPDDDPDDDPDNAASTPSTADLMDIARGAASDGGKISDYGNKAGRNVKECKKILRDYWNLKVLAVVDGEGYIKYGNESVIVKFRQKKPWWRKPRYEAIVDSAAAESPHSKEFVYEEGNYHRALVRALNWSIKKIDELYLPTLAPA